MKLLSLCQRAESSAVSDEIGMQGVTLLRNEATLQSIARFHPLGHVLQN